MFPSSLRSRFALTLIGASLVVAMIPSAVHAAWPPEEAVSSEEATDALHRAVWAETASVDPVRRAWAWRALAGALDADFLKRHPRGLADPDPLVRREVVAGLRRFIEPLNESDDARLAAAQAQTAVAGRLRDSSDRVREAAARVIDAPRFELRGTADLAYGLGDELEFVREVCLRRVGHIAASANSREIDRLIDVVKHGDPAVRIAGLRQLTALYHRPASFTETTTVPASVRGAAELAAKHDDPLVRRWAIPLAATTFADLRSRFENDPSPLVRGRLVHLADYSPFVGPMEAKVDWAIESGDPLIQEWGAMRLTEQRYERANGFNLSRELGSDQPYRADAAARAFASRIWNVASSASDEIPLVVGLVQPEVLANSPDPSERRCAASVLAAVVGSLEHTTQETFRARHRKAEDVQMWRDGASYSRKSPSRLFCELVLPAVHKAFDDPDPFVRGRAAAIVLLAGARAEGDGLPREGDESLWPRAVQAFDDPSPEVRRCAYVAAASICWRVEPSCLSPEESQSLWARLVEGLDDPEPRIRRTLHLELLKTTTQRYAPYPYLNQFYPIEKLPDGATPLRASRVKELGKPGLWDRLVAGCHDSDPFVRRDVFAALASLPASPDYATKVPPLLLEAAVAQLADPDPRVARPAAAWLAQFPPQPALTDYFAKRLQEPAPPEAAEEEFGEWLAAAEWMLTYSPDATPIGAALDYLTTSESHFRYELAASALRIVLNANRLDDFLARLAAAPPDRERLYATRLNGAAPWSDAQLAALARFTAELGPERVELTKSLLLTLHERGVPAIDEQIAKWANDPATGPTLRFATLELGALARGDALAAPLGSSDPIAGLLALTTLRRAAAAGIAGPDASALPKHAQALLAGVKRR